jgi:hypothetical protein
LSDDDHKTPQAHSRKIKQSLLVIFSVFIKPINRYLDIIKMNGELLLNASGSSTARITEVSARRCVARRRSSDSIGSNSSGTLMSRGSRSTSRLPLKRQLSSQSRQRRPSLIHDPQRVEDTLANLRNMRISVRESRRALEDDRDEARIAVQELKDIRERVKQHFRAHFPFSTLEQELLNSSMSSMRQSEEEDDYDDDSDDDERYE